MLECRVNPVLKIQAAMKTIRLCYLRVFQDVLSESFCVEDGIANGGDGGLVACIALGGWLYRRLVCSHETL